MPLQQCNATAATTTTTATATATTKLTTSYSSNNNNNNNNLRLIKTPTDTSDVMQTNLYTARSKRRRRRSSWQRSSSSSSSNNNNNQTPAYTTPTTTPTTPTTSASSQRLAMPRLLQTALHALYSSCSESSISSCRATAYVALLLLSTTCSLCAAASPCAPKHWWDPVQGKCMPCTACQAEMIPLRPCQLHRDTICGSIYDLNIDWVVLAKTEPNWKERRKSEYEHFEHAAPLQHLTHEQLQQLHEEAAASLPLDWQTGALFLAVLACLLFFSVAACILLHHMRQWRRMERRLDQDVEELSTKLMAKLAEVQSLEGGTFFIGNADALRGMPTSAVAAAAAASAASVHAATANTAIFQPQHVLLPDKHAKHHHHHERRILKTLQPGNVYIEENGSKG